MGQPHPGSSGKLRVSRRELDPVLSTDFQPVQAHRRREKLKPGEIVPVDIAIYLQWQVERIGGTFGHDVTSVLEQLEAGVAGVAKLNPSPEARLPLGVVYIYSPLEADRPSEAERVVFRQRATEVKRQCWGCYQARTHCQGGTVDLGGQGRDNPIANDLLELAREDEYDWAVVVCTDLMFIPVARYLQSHGRKIIHGCFPPVAMDLTKGCWASIDLRLLNRGLE